MALERVRGSQRAIASGRGAGRALCDSYQRTLVRRHVTKRRPGWRDSVPSLSRQPSATVSMRPCSPAVVHVESGGNPQAVSPVGAQGLTQLIPATAQGSGVHDPFDPAQERSTVRPSICGGYWGSLGVTYPKPSRPIMPVRGMSRNTGVSPRLPRPRLYVPAVLAVYDTYRQPQPASPGGVGPFHQDLQRPSGDIAAVDSGGILASTPSSLRLAWLLEAATLRPAQSRPERRSLTAKTLGRAQGP